MKSKIRRRLFRWLLLPVGILLLLICVAVGILVTQQERLVKLAVRELNKQLPDGSVEVGGSQVAIFQNFPYISIALLDVRLFGGKGEIDSPIFRSERVFVGFSLNDVLRQHYLVKAISIKNGYVRLLQDTAGNLNIVEAMRVPASGDTSSSGKSFELDIKKFVFKNMDVSFLDLKSRERFDSHVDRIQASFRLDGNKMFVAVQSGLQFDYLKGGFRHRRLGTTVQLAWDMDRKVVDVPVGKIQLEDAVFNITGMADLSHGDSVDLHVTGDKPDFKQLFAFASESVTKELEHFRYDGDLSFDGIIQGKLGGRRMPLINLTFSCVHAYLHNTKAKKNLDSLSFKGYYTNGAEHSLRTSELRLTDMTARPDKGRFTGNFVMRDFTDPKILMQVNSELELGFIGGFLGIRDLEKLTGHINLKMDFNELVDISMPQQSLSQLTQGIQSELTVRDLSFIIPEYPHPVEHLNLHAAMKNGFVTLDSLSGSVGGTDLHLQATLDDLPALFHHRHQPVTLQCDIRSGRVVLGDFLDSTSKWSHEEVYGFHIGLFAKTSVDELLHPQPIPRGQIRIDSLCASFKRYPHAFHDFGADLTVNDTAVFLRNFRGMIDSSDLLLNGRVVNYALWFSKVKRGKTQIAFDLKSRHMAMKDVLGHKTRLLVPVDYRTEVGSGIWLRSKIDLRYDSVFQFASVKIAHISGVLVGHQFQLDSIRGNVKFGIDEYIKIDTLQGKIGNSDFLLSMRIYNGKDTARRKKENYLQFSSRLLDVDQLSSYKLEGDTSTSSPDSAVVVAASHDSSFNIFQIPFIDFNGAVDIGKIKFKHLSSKNVTARVRMTTGQQLYLDTLGLDIAGGRITARAHFNGSDPKKIYLRSRLDFHEVNLEKLLLKLDYLGQDYVINKNIIGTVNGEIKSYVLVHPDMTPIIDQSEAQIAVEIHNGALINFAPMQAMSTYFKDKNLNMIRFDTLRNTLSLKNGALSIPDMSINSSLGYMEVAGRQSLDMQMEYDLRIPLKLVTDAGFSKLFGRRREEVDSTQVDAIEYRDKDKRVHFINLKVVGTPDAYKVELGKAKN